METRFSTGPWVSITITAVALGFAAYVQLAPDPPTHPDLSEVPAPVLGNALPTLAEQVRSAYEAAKAEPTLVRPNAEYCLVLHAYKQLAMAENCYRRLQQLAPRDFRWAYLIAVAQEGIGQPEAAAISYQQAIEIEPWFFPAKLKLAQLLLQLGETERAGSLYSELLDAHFSAALVQNSVGRWYMSSGEPERAIELLEQAVDTEPYFGEAHYALAMAYRTHGDIQKARHHSALHQRYRDVPPPADPILAEVMEQDRSVRTRLEHASEFVASGRYQEAVAEYQAVLKIAPGNALVHANLITTHANLGELDRAEAHYRQALAVRPDWAQAHYLLGRAKLHADYPREAIESLSQAVARDPYYDDAYLLRGVALQQVGRLKEAEASFREAIEVSPGNRTAHLELGGLLWGLEQAEEGEYHFQRLLEIEDERTAQFHGMIAQFFLERGQRYRAIDHFRRGEDSARLHGSSDVAERLKQRARALER